MNRYILLIYLTISFCLVQSCQKYDFTPEGYGSMSDIEGNTYQTVKIGKKWWMAENLKTTKYNDGENILHITDAAEWATLTSGAHCWYDNDIENKPIYGALYNWFTVNTGKLCPTGWHVPGDDEWNFLYNYLGKSYTAGRIMMETETNHWKNMQFGVTNESGFSGLPGGWRGSWSFNSIGTKAFWWSSTEYYTAKAWYMYLGGNPAYFGRGFTNDLFNGYSVRCIKD